jgi:hypothetical protein
VASQERREKSGGVSAEDTEKDPRRNAEAKLKSQGSDDIANGGGKATCSVELTNHVTTGVNSLSRNNCKWLAGKGIHPAEVELSLRFFSA